eukprot:3710439-Alexandrium_andersonii.AAC.1
MGRNSHTLAGPSGRSELSCPKPSLEGGRGPSLPNGPNGPLRWSESADIGAPICSEAEAGGARI